MGIIGRRGVVATELDVNCQLSIVNCALGRA
jgi:hypothetical protein